MRSERSGHIGRAPGIGGRDALSLNGRPETWPATGEAPAADHDWPVMEPPRPCVQHRREGPPALGPSLAGWAAARPPATRHPALGASLGEPRRPPGAPRSTGSPGIQRVVRRHGLSSVVQGARWRRRGVRHSSRPACRGPAEPWSGARGQPFRRGLSPAAPMLRCLRRLPRRGRHTRHGPGRGPPPARPPSRPPRCGSRRRRARRASNRPWHGPYAPVARRSRHVGPFGR